MNNKAHLRPKDFDSNGDIIPMACKEESGMNNDLRYYGNPMNWESTKGDLISREALRKAFHGRIYYFDKSSWDEANALIDSAPSVDIKDEMAGAYNEGYVCGNKEAEKARPQGKYMDISKLRLMTVEECAGHTIDYAMGWKACIEWIKKGGAGNA